MINLTFFDTKEYDRVSFDTYLKEHNLTNISIKYLETKLNADTASLAKGSDGVIVFVNDTIDNKVIDKLVEFGVKAIFLRCAGYNNVDIKYAFSRIHVYRVPAYSPYAVAEFAFAMLQTSNRRIHKAYNRIKDYNFSLVGFTGSDLHSKTVGVIGTGKIGKVFINIAKGFGMKVLAYDKYPSNIDGVNYVELDELFSKSDYISLHCPLTEENYHMIDKSALDKMKKNVIIVNTSRGGLIDAQALLDAIKSRKISGACLDVYEEESDIFFVDKSNHIMDDNILLQLIAMPNVIITSHQAFLTNEALDNIAETTINNAISFFENNSISENEVCYHCPNMANCKKNRKEKCF